MVEGAPIVPRATAYPNWLKLRGFQGLWAHGSQGERGADATAGVVATVSLALGSPSHHCCPWCVSRLVIAGLGDIPPSLVPIGCLTWWFKDQLKIFHAWNSLNAGGLATPEDLSLCSWWGKTLTTEPAHPTRSGQLGIATYATTKAITSLSYQWNDGNMTSQSVNEPGQFIPTASASGCFAGGTGPDCSKYEPSSNLISWL